MKNNKKLKYNDFFNISGLFYFLFNNFNLLIDNFDLLINHFQSNFDRLYVGN